MTDWIQALERLLAAFDRLGIQYMIGGSLPGTQREFGDRNLARTRTSTSLWI